MMDSGQLLQPADEYIAGLRLADLEVRQIHQRFFKLCGPRQIPEDPRDFGL